MIVYEVTFSATVAGDVASFDATKQEQYKEGLSELLGVKTEDIELQIAAASITVTAIIKTAGASAAESLTSAINEQPASAFASATGVIIESIAPASVTTRQVPAPAPPPPAPPSPSPPVETLNSTVSNVVDAQTAADEGDGGVGRTVGIVIGVVLFVVIVLGFGVWYMRKRVGATTQRKDEQFAPIVAPGASIAEDVEAAYAAPPAVTTAPATKVSYAANVPSADTMSSPQPSPAPAIKLAPETIQAAATEEAGASPRGAETLHSFAVESKAALVGVASEDPEADHKAVKAKLREYEQTYEAQHGVKPRKRSEWGEMWPEYERYAVLRKMASDKKLASAGSSTDLA